MVVREIEGREEGKESEREGDSYRDIYTSCIQKPKGFAITQSEHSSIQVMGERTRKCLWS